MLRNRRRTVLVVIAAAAAIFVAAGGPATAGKLVTKNQIAPGAVTGKAIANGAITDAKLSAGLRKAIKKTGASGAAGAPGANGANGANGAPGAAGARGPAGAFNLVDATGKVIGQYAGMYSSGFPMAYTAEGAILTYDNNSPTNYPSFASSGPLYYKANGCTGQPYAYVSSSYLFQHSIVLESPPSPGSKIYVGIPGTPESFTAESARSSSGCSDTNSGASQVYTVKEAGTVPTVTKPVLIQPAP